MKQRISYLYLLILLISCALRAQAQVGLPEQVCVGTVQHYWVEGLPGSTYTWRINGVIQSSTADNIDIQWNEIGDFTLEVQEHQLTCDGDVQRGLVTVTDQIIPEFNLVNEYCTGSVIAALPTTSTNGITGIWSPVLNNTATTTYNFTPDASQCAVPVELTITITDGILPIFEPIAAICSGSPAISLPTTSQNNITGSWSPAFNNTRTTEYTFTPDNGQCATTTTLTVVVNDAIIPTFDPVGSYCAGSVVAALPTISSNGIRGTWLPAIDNIRTTTYTFTPDEGQCATTVTQTIIINDQVTPSFAPMAAVCSGETITLPEASLEGITGTWSPAVNNTVTTTYIFTPDANYQCATTTELTITINDAVTPTFAQIGPYCAGYVFAALPTTSINGITGSWSPAIDNTRTTTYTFTPDANQCAVSVPLTITISDQIIPAFVQVGPYCSGATIPDLPTTSTNNITGTWSPAINNIQTTEYTFTPDTGQCGTISTMTISISDEITPIFAQVGPYCAGSTIPALPTTSINGVTGTWNPAIDNTQTATYTFTPDAGQCGTSTAMTITISDEIIPTFAQVGPYCAGSAIPELPTTSINNITGSWSPAIDNTRTTTYTFTPDAGQCGTSTTMTITISDEISPTFAQVGPYCAGFAIPDLPNTSSNGITGSWNPAIDNTRTTTYTFTPDAGQCGTSTTMTITISDEISPTFAQVGPYCAGFAIPDLPTTSTNGITGSWNPAIDNTRTTTYTFTPDAGQCGTTTTLTIVINEETLPVFNPVGPFNAGSVIAALPTTSNNGITGTWSPAIDNTRTTTYTFTPDPGQCALPTTLTIVINGEIIPLFDPIGPLCSGATINLPTTSNNGITGSWSPAINNTQTTTYTFTPDPGQGAVTATLTVEITNGITPLFDPIGPLCSGTTFSLPTTSNNGVTGSWSPAIDNTITITYTFTPDEGQCSSTTTLTVSVSDEITPVFAAVGPYCTGAAIADLPTVSNNGITGTWFPAIDNTQSTTYTFTPDAGQCGVPTTLTIDITDGITPAFDPIGPLCAGSAIVLPVRSNNGITGSWSPAIDNTQTTEYTFTPDAGQCAVPTTLTVTIANEIMPVFTITDIYCAGAAIAALPTTSENGITGSWSPAINNTQTTEYTFTPDPGQCGVPTTLTITISNEIIPTFEAVGPACAGSAIAALPTTSTNGITGSWSPAIDNTRTTTYTFTPDAGQCAITANLTIEITNGIIPVFAAVGPYCPSDAIAELPSVSNNGISGSWSPAINNQLTTTYTFTPDEGQCATTTTLTIAINPGVIPVFDAANTYCPGEVIAALPTVSNNGISGSWSPEIDNTRTTTYTFTPEAGQCAVSTTLTIVIEQGTIPTFNPAGNYCPGADIAALPTTSNNGITGSWSPEIDNTRTTTYTFTPDGGQCATTAILTIVIDQSIIPTFDAMGPYCPGSNVPDLPTVSNNGISGSWSPAIDNSRTTTYTFTPDDGQCATTATLTIVMEGTIVPEFDAMAAICSGEELALPTVSNNGISGSWSPAINNTQTTTYTFTPDGGQCGTTTTLTVEVNRRTIPEFNPVGPYCPGDAIAELPSVSNNGISGSWSPAIDNTRTTTYTFTPDGGQCASSTTLTIVINLGILPTFDPVGPYCLGDAIADLPTVSNNGIRGSWSPAIDNTQSGTYTFTPDDGQCASSTMLSIVVEQSITPTFSPVGPFCPGSDIPALPTVSNNGIRGSWSPAIDNTQTTTYIFTADDGMCPATVTLTIVIDQSVNPIFNPVGPFCPGTEIAALPIVSANGIHGSWSPEIDNTQTTTYTFTPDEGQCGSPTSLTVEITDQINPTFDAIAPVCSGTPFSLPLASREGIAGTWSPEIDNTQTTTYTFTPIGGACANTATLTVDVLEGTTPEFSAVGPFCPGTDIGELPRISNNGISGSWSPAINNMTTTTYTFVPDDGQCARITTLTIEIQESITPIFDPVGTYCRGASISLLPNVSNNGISGSWSPAVNNQQSTTYTFTPDEGQCAATTTLTILITDQLIPEFDAVGTYCPGASIAALSTTSNNGISGSWSPAINNRQTTTYTFTPDEGQCAATAMLTITVDANIVPEFDALAPICSGGIIRLPDVSNNGISGSWSPAVNNTQTTTYTFTPDEGQCATTATLTVEVQPVIIPSFDPVGPYCPGAAIAALPTTSTNGVHGSWSPQIDNTRTTTYTFTPDDGPCVSTASLTIVIDQSITPTFDQPGSYCPGAAITALPTVSNNGISGSWSPVINNTRTTTYTFTPDEGQCATTATLTIFIDQSIVPTFEAVGPFCPGANIPALPTTSNNGISGSWSPAINNQQTTTYTFTPDAGQCGTVTTLTININQSIVPTFTAVGPFCPGEDIPALPTVSNNGIRGSWSPVINNQQTTTYTFTPDEGQCGLSTSLTIVVNPPVTPTFASVGPYCAGTTIGALPTISNNGITGSWSPAINNQQTTTYTFTPDAGQCAQVTTLTININEEIAPVFTQIGPYCAGSSIPALPTISNNGIRGSWSPAINNTQTATYTFTPNAGQCAVPGTMTIEISDEITPLFDAMGPYCRDAGFTLPAVSNNGIRGSWSPAINSQQTTIYTFTPNSGQCGIQTTLTVEISDQITPLFDPIGPYCRGAAISALPTVSNNGISGSWRPAVNNTQTTTYTFTPDAGQCGAVTTLTIVISDQMTPTFAAVGPYCAGATIEALPTVSNNGISGSWSPAINNQQTTTYTFTPDAGQCGQVTTLTIRINNELTPIFSQAGPYCTGSVIPALPTVSNNGIRGSWSPAIDNTQTTTYTFTPDPEQCASTSTMTITISDEIIPIFNAPAAYCVGSAIAALPTISNNGIRGSWSPAINNQQTTAYTFTPNTGQCAATASLTIDISDQITPTFDPVGPYTVGSAIPALLTVSNNGIRGSWSPAINNRQTTTYTFTPNAGQCAVPVTLTIDITDQVIPTFDPVGPYCAGSDIAALPTVSNNGITGSWSPAINNQQTTTYTFTPDAGQSAGITRLTITINNEVRPTFTAIGPYCAGTTIAALPTISNNGITGTWSPDINNQQTTTYTFTPDPGQCAITATITISISDQITPIFTPVGPYCAGSTIAALPNISNNGIRGTWSPAIDNTQTTIYTFTPDAGQCAVPLTMTIDITDQVIPTFDPVGPYTVGSAIPTLPVISNNGIRGTWAPAIDNRQTTTYTFTPNAGQCAVPTTLTIDITDQVIPTLDPVGPYCAGSIIEDLPTVSNNGIRGSWSPAINNQQTTTYTFTPDAGQSAGVARLTITINNEVRPIFDPVNSYCAGSVIAELPSISNNGIRGTWTPEINNQQTTPYTFTPDPGQCATTAAVTIAISNEITPTFTSVGSYCEGSAIPALPTVSNNGIRGSWSPAIDNTQTTIYTFTPDAGQCATTAVLTIVIRPSVTPEFDPVGPFCPESVIAALPSVSNNGIRGSWSPAINNTRTTTYTFTPTTGQCAVPVTMTIDISDEILPTFNPVGPFCPGAIIADLPTVSTNGIHGRWRPAVNNRQTTTYTFTPDAGECGTTTTLTIAIEENATPTFDAVGPYCVGSVIVPLPAVSNNGIQGTWRPAINNNRTTTYTFTPNAGECGTTTTMTIAITDEIVPAFDPVGPYCLGAVIADLPTVSNNGIRGSWTPAINNQQTTTYTFIPDAGQCATTATLRIVINQRNIPTFDQVASYCRGSAITALRTVSNNGIRGSWRPAIDNTRTTTYTFTPDADQCGEPTTMTIQITDEVEPVFDPVGPYHHGAAIAALRTVSNNGIRGSWRPAIDNTRTTTYTFTPDAGQCSRPVRMTIAITDDIIPVFDPVGPYCPGDVIAALPIVSNNGIRGSWSPAINNQQTTTYTFIPDAGQSAAIVTMTITINDAIVPVFNPVEPFCPGSMIAELPVVSNNGIRGTWAPAINNQQTTTYTFTPDAGQCASTTTLTINITGEILPTFDQVRPYCPGSAIAALPLVSNNGIRGSWSPVINNQQTTLYIFTPDEGQCALPTTLTIEIGTDILPEFDLVGPFCPGTDIEALPTVSKNGIHGTWSPVINNMVTTDYMFTPDEGQCAVSTSLTCEIGSEITPVFDQVGPFCYGETIAALPTTSLNGVPGTWWPAINNTQTTTYTFTPTPGRCALPTVMTLTIAEPTIPTFAPVPYYCTGSMIAELPATSLNGITGTWSPAIDNTRTTIYTFTPDAGQCATTAEMTITITDETVPIFAVMDSWCQGADISSLPLISTNGIKGSWSPAINNQQTTTYTFTPDEGQCAASATLVITIDPKTTPTFAAVASYCPGEEIPDLPLVSNNGIRGTWSPAIDNTKTTTYTFTPNEGQCANTAVLTIEIKESIVPEFALPDIYCTGAVIAALPRTSINNIKGSWSPAINNQQTTTYTFTPDAGQCASTTELTILINPEPALPVTRVIQPNCNTATGAVEVVSPRGSQYQYSLDGGSYRNEALFRELAPGSNHTLQVRDVLTGCESKVTTATINSLPQPPSAPVVVLVVNPKCDGGGVIQVTDPTGPDYEYNLDGGTYQSQPVFNNVTWGEHLIRVRNKINGCESAATSVIIPDVPNDMDFDGIADDLDADVDGDGILNSLEGGLTADSDGDGRMNYMDIDADDDGIVDILEAQNIAGFILPSYMDEDNDGLDDAYDKDQKGTEIIPVDSDKDGTPDFMDLDSDNDLVPDYIEGHDQDSNGKPDHLALNADDDNDGLDNGYDNIANICGAYENALGSNAPTQDFDGDGMPDWRDENDDDDEYLTRYEDLNGDGDFSNDDIDFDGYPEYLDYGRECDLFIPDAFSPNGDNVHDSYMIYCINHYPDATIYIFDQLGNKIYEKRHYGNLEFWKTPQAAWWDGKPTRGPGYSRNDLVPPGTYYYVLDLGNGQVKKSYVFVSY
jgi:gliding motility-associated-like protein